MTLGTTVSTTTFSITLAKMTPSMTISITTFGTTTISTTTFSITKMAYLQNSSSRGSTSSPASCQDQIQPLKIIENKFIFTSISGAFTFRHLHFLAD